MSSPQPFSSCEVVGGPFRKRKERVIEAVVQRQLRQRRRPGKDLPHLLLEALGIQPVDVVIAVVGEQQAALFDEELQLIALGATEPHQLVARHEQEREREQLLGVGGDDDFLGEEWEWWCTRRSS